MLNTDLDPDPDPAFHAEHPGSGSRVFTTKKWEKFTAEKNLIFLLSKIAIFLSLDLHKGRPSYRRSLQPAKENIQDFKT
jgi:hypothetical protein